MKKLSMINYSQQVLFLDTYSWHNYIRVLLLLSTRNTGQIIKCKAEILILKGFLPTSQQPQPIKLELIWTCIIQVNRAKQTKEKVFSCMLLSICVQVVSLRLPPPISRCRDPSEQAAPALSSNLLHVHDFYSEIPLRPLKKPTVLQQVVGLRRCHCHCSVWAPWNPGFTDTGGQRADRFSSNRAPL